MYYTMDLLRKVLKEQTDIIMNVIQFLNIDEKRFLGLVPQKLPIGRSGHIALPQVDITVTPTQWDTEVIQVKVAHNGQEYRYHIHRPQSYALNSQNIQDPFLITAYSPGTSKYYTMTEWGHKSSSPSAFVESHKP